MSELASFAGQMLRNPKEVMALAPSSRALCRLMAEQVKGLSGPIVELGGGTGRITEALLEAGVAPSDLHVIELNPEFVQMLKGKFPDVAIHQRGAQTVSELDLGPVSAVVSGLPLLGMSQELQGAIVRGVFDVVKPGGPFIQFTYGPKPPIRSALRTELGLHHKRMGGVLLNAPPASVYRFTKPVN